MPHRWFKWQPAELDYLRDLVGDYPLSWIVKDYNRWAERNGRPTRTKQSIQKAILLKLNHTTVPCGEWLSTYDVGKLVGRSQDAIYIWIKREWICRDHRRYDGNGYLICRRGLRQLARDRPDLLKHLNREQLFNLLEDESVVEHVVDAPVAARRRTVPVRCLETDQIFCSMRSAATLLGLPHDSVRMAIINNGTAKGYHFQEAA